MRREGEKPSYPEGFLIWEEVKEGVFKGKKEGGEIRYYTLLPPDLAIQKDTRWIPLFFHQKLFPSFRTQHINEGILNRIDEELYYRSKDLDSAIRLVNEVLSKLDSDQAANYKIIESIRAKIMETDQRAERRQTIDVTLMEMVDDNRNKMEHVFCGKHNETLFCFMKFPEWIQELRSSKSIVDVMNTFLNRKRPNGANENYFSPERLSFINGKWYYKLNFSKKNIITLKNTYNELNQSTRDEILMLTVYLPDFPPPHPLGH